MEKLDRNFERFFDWLNAEDKTKKEKYLKMGIVFGFLLGAIALVGYIDNPADYQNTAPITYDGAY